MTMLSDGFSPDFYLVGGNKILLFFNTYNEIVFVLFEERCAMISLCLNGSLYWIPSFVHCNLWVFYMFKSF